MLYILDPFKRCIQCRKFYLEHNLNSPYFTPSRTSSVCIKCYKAIEQSIHNEEQWQRHNYNKALAEKTVDFSEDTISTSADKHKKIVAALEGMKACNCCLQTFPMTDEYFHRDKSKADGFHTFCRKCRNDREVSRRAANPEGQKAIRQRFYQKHREQVIREVKEYNERNHEKRAAYEREYWKQNVDKRQAKHVRRKAAKKRLPNTFTAQDWERCLDYWDHRCAVCGRAADETTVLSPDHWIALTDPREDNPGTVPTNIVPLCGSLKGGRNGCNNSKHKRNAVTWLIEKYGEGEAQVILGRIKVYFESLG